jgi:hypothetical protein
VIEAVAEIDKAMCFAYQQKNPMSIAKLLENKGRLYGLYVDRFQEVPIDLTGALQAARTRVLTAIDLTPPPSNGGGGIVADPASYRGPGRPGDPLGD